MAMLRAKQIKLVAQGDLLIGGVNGAGGVLTKGALGTFLKPTATGLEWATVASTEILHGETTVGAALDALDATVTDHGTRLTTAEGEIDTLQTDLSTLTTRVETAEADIDALELSAGNTETRVGNIIAGLGFDAESGEFVALTGDYVDTATSTKGAIEALDAAIANLADSAANDSFVNSGIGVRALTSTKKDAAINEVFAKSNIAKVDADNAPSINDDSADGYKVGDIWVNGVNAYVALDVTVGAAVWSRIDQNVNAALFTYKGTKDASGPSEALAGNHETGDTYKITGAGDFTEGLDFFVNVGDFIVYNGVNWDKIDSTNTVVAGDAGKIVVDGNTDSGFTVTIDPTYVGQASLTTLGTVTTGTWNATTIAQAFGGTGITTVTTSADANKVLTVGAAGTLEYAFATTLRDSAGVEVATTVNGALIAAEADMGEGPQTAYTTKWYVDSQIDSLASASARVQFSQEITIDEAEIIAFVLEVAPEAGAVAGYFNGLKMPKAAFTVTGTDVALVPATLGYTTEVGDIIEFTYTVDPADIPAE